MPFSPPAWRGAGEREDRAKSDTRIENGKKSGQQARFFCFLRTAANGYAANGLHPESVQVFSLDNRPVDRNAFVRGINRELKEKQGENDEFWSMPQMRPDANPEGNVPVLRQTAGFLQGSGLCKIHTTPGTRTSFGQDRDSG
jgi:hypothetical protein